MKGTSNCGTPHIHMAESAQECIDFNEVLQIWIAFLNAISRYIILIMFFKWHTSSSWSVQPQYHKCVATIAQVYCVILGRDSMGAESCLNILRLLTSVTKPESEIRLFRGEDLASATVAPGACINAAMRAWSGANCTPFVKILAKSKPHSYLECSSLLPHPK